MQSMIHKTTKKVKYKTLRIPVPNQQSPFPALERVSLKMLKIYIHMAKIPPITIRMPPLSKAVCFCKEFTPLVAMTSLLTSPSEMSTLAAFKGE